MRFFSFKPVVCAALCGVFLAGCQRADNAAKDAARRALRSKMEKTESGGKIGSVLSTDSQLRGRDRQGRVLWEVGARQITAYEEKVQGGKVEPFRADLKDAHATLYRNGAPHSTFRAPLIQLIRAEKGAQLSLTGGVSMKTPGTFASPEDAKKGARKLSGDGPIELKAPRIDIDIEGRKLTANQGASIAQGKTRLTAKTLRADSELAVANLDGGVQASTRGGVIRARRAVWNWKAKRAQASGAVTLAHKDVTLSGETLDANLGGERGQLAPAKGARVLAKSPRGQADAGLLRYDWNRGQIETSGGVTFSKDGATMRAANLSSDDKFARAVASGGVTFQKDGGTLRAQSITALDKMTRAVASGDVTLQKDDAVLRARNVVAFDKMTRATASGGVTMQRGNVTLRAAGADAFIPEKRVEARGEVVVTRPDAQLRASRATAWLESGRVVASGVEVRREGGTVSAPNVELTGAQNASTARLTASGGVLARTNRGTVRASQVVWQGAGTRGAGRVLASGSVSLQSGSSTLSGARLESSDDFERATLSGNVGGTLRGRNGDTRFSAGTVRREGARVLARGGVAARQQKVTLRANRMDAGIDGENATLSGDVVATTSDGVTVRAPQVRYDKRANKIYASGGVVVRDPKRGEQRSQTLVAELGGKGLEKITTSKVRGTLNQSVTNDLFR